MYFLCFSEEIFQTISRAVDWGSWWSVTTQAVAQVMVDNSVTRDKGECVRHIMLPDNC